MLCLIIRLSQTLNWLELKCGYAHRDISYNNIVFDTNLDYPHNISSVKFIDFDSLSYVYDFSDKSFGTPAFASPDNIKNKSYQYRENDAWSLGILICFCVTKKIPHIKNNIDINNFIIKEQINIYIGNIIKMLLNINPKKRSNYGDILEKSLNYYKII
jgi:serine/threonine protein kinase